jgi:hypothetical protein
MERQRHKCLRLYQAALPAEKGKSETKSALVNWWMDLLGQLCAAGELRGRSRGLCAVRDKAGVGFGTGWD